MNETCAKVDLYLFVKIVFILCVNSRYVKDDDVVDDPHGKDGGTSPTLKHTSIIYFIVNFLFLFEDVVDCRFKIKLHIYVIKSNYNDFVILLILLSKI